MIVARELLRDLLCHMEWADARVWAAVPADLDDGRTRALLAHMHTVPHAFLTIWRAGDDLHTVLRQSDGFTSLPDLRDWARSFYAAAHAIVDRAGDPDLASVVEMPWAAQIADSLGYPPGPTSLAETILQVTSHSTYHRGQLNARLRELGLTPPLVDYIAWLWERRPAPDWPASERPL
jgi:uncharacterized damage-inducible protein DinB